jgi:hypothetical protein
MMQIRNHVIQHRPVDVRESIDISCTITGQRVAAKGVEMDIYTGLEAASALSRIDPPVLSETDPPV